MLFRSFYIRGRFDAEKYYKNYHGAGTICYFGGLFGGLILDLIPTLICTSTPPQDSNLGNKNSELMKNPDYFKGYKEKAFSIKRHKCWNNYGYGVGTLVVVSTVFLFFVSIKINFIYQKNQLK